MKCLLCYKPITDLKLEYHEKCIVKKFGFDTIPEIEIDMERLAEYAKKMVSANTTITGVQPKLSMWLEENRKNIRFTIQDNKSNYIIKPRSEMYEALPENEDLCMHLAECFKIETAVHGLIRLIDGSLAYITKRFDRNGTQKLACEDLCQLSEVLTEHKYRGSYEKMGKTIKKYSSLPGLDTLHFFELVVFSFITGNADMHLKNFSMLEKEVGMFILSPAYDLINTRLVIKNDNEQLALNVNGKKNKLEKKDFDRLGSSLTLTQKQIQNTYLKFKKNIKIAEWWIDNSFLPDKQKMQFKEIIAGRVKLMSQ